MVLQARGPWAINVEAPFPLGVWAVEPGQPRLLLLPPPPPLGPSPLQLLSISLLLPFLLLLSDFHFLYFPLPKK